MDTTLITGVAMAFFVSLLAMRVLCSRHCARFVVDHPNARSLHSVPTPRTGGIAIMIGAGVAWLWVSGHALPPIALLTGALAMLFLIEDAIGLRIGLRLAAQCTAAGLFLLSLEPLPWPFFFVLAIATVWSANCYNFMDGSDGLAGGMTVIGFGAYAAAAASAGHDNIALLAGIVSAAGMAFLIWNIAPARIFMGDTGAIPLGFLAAAIGFVGWKDGAWPFWLPALVFSVFLVDATVTLLNRFVQGEPVLRAHCAHHYQRLIRMGWSHRRLALTAYLLMITTAGSALLFRQAHPVAALAMLMAWVLAFSGISFTINTRWRRHAAGLDGSDAPSSVFAQ